ncbi:hypothetical protein [Arachidicoccus terrestris]|uniref:hypothetical protein n=1 Tax=Arachidicoccus terrestris TaxID=2875539 RepID=UPI001CC381B2|nr:hypothetical protein [Arachidicoccus terrestris]UAY54098.1 hypothetical protein K9M52_11530 [Arachidicoccus terrestris]
METNAHKEHLKDFQESKDAAKKFLAEGFGPLIKKVFFQPLELNQEFKQPDAQVKTTVLVLLTGILFTFLPYLLVGSARRFLGFRFFLQIGIAVMIALIFIGLLTWCIKKIHHKQVEFQNELLTGALCALPLIVLLIVICLLQLFFSGHNYLGGFSSFFSGSWSTIFSVYAFFLMITICFQSLRSVFIKANTAWYLSPAIVMLGFYMAIKIVQWA